MPRFNSIEHYQNSFNYLDADLIQLEKGEFNGSYEQQQLISCKIESRQSQTQHIHRSTSDQSLLSLVFPKNLLSSFIQINGFDMDNSHQILDANGEILNAVIPSNFDVNILVLDKAKVELNLSQPLECPETMRRLKVNIFERHLLMSKLNYAIRLLNQEKIKDNIKVKMDLESSLYALASKYIEDNLCKGEPAKISIHAKERKRVLDLLYALPFSRLNVSSLASEAYFSVRKLHYLCTSTWGKTPNELITHARFRHINRALHNGVFVGKPLVSALLTEFGITNPSRFKQKYLSIYGETPKQTLAKSSG